jgi:hypothetical protein
MSGGKGGGSTTSVEVPEYIERAAQRNLNKAEGISQIGYTPYYGPDVAAFTPSQQSAFQNTADAASAFGMAAPTSQQDIMGGMGAPTTYANGVSGYSSAPMFQQSLDQLQAERPGQKDYIDSFFIDPFTGQAGSRVSAPVNYEDYMTSAESGRNEAEANRQNDLAMANANNAGNLAVANAAYKGPSSIYYNNEDTVMNTIGGGASASGGSAGSFDSPSTEGSYGGSLMTGDPTEVTGNVSTYDPNMVITNPITNNTSTGGYNFDPTDYNSDYGSAPTGYEGGYTSIGDMFDGGGAGRSGSTYDGGGVVSDLGNSVTTSVDLPGNVFSRALNIGAGKKDSSSDLCTAYCDMGYLPREIYKLDRRYGVSLYRNDPSLIWGYRKWATPIAEFIKTDTLAAKATRAVMWPIVKAWAEQMAHEMKPQKYNRNIAGKAIMLVGVPFSRFVGAVFVSKSVSKEAF